MNSEWADTQLGRFIDMTAIRPMSSPIVGGRYSAVAEREEVLAQWVIVEAILGEVYPAWRDRHAGSQRYEFRAQRDAAIHARALLSAQSEIEANLGPVGPVLSSASLHHWVWDSAKPLWGDGHYRAAVQAAATAVDVHLQQLLDVRDLSGVDLVNQALSTNRPEPGRPRLRVVADGNADTTRSLQAGLRSLGEACFALVRNPVSHSLADLSEAAALERLAVLSLFSDMVGRCEIERADG